MNKTIEALLRGYLLFRVNGNYFLFYNKARNERMRLCEQASLSVRFDGLHIFKGWLTFYSKVCL